MTDRKPSFAVTALLVAVGVVLWLGLWVQLAVVPAAKKRFDEFGLQLPGLTKLVIEVSDLVGANSWLGVFAAIGGALVWGGFVGWLRHQPRWAVAVTLIAALVIAALLAANLVAAAGLLLSEVKLQEGLRR